MDNFSRPEALNGEKVTYMGMVDRGFTVAAKKWVLFLVICKLPLPLGFRGLYVMCSFGFQSCMHYVLNLLHLFSTHCSCHLEGE
jgi:hypothetical protein